MMQGGDSHGQKRSLFSAMNRFMGAVANMEQSVMVPSVLRGVPLVSGTAEHSAEHSATMGPSAEHSATMGPSVGPSVTVPPSIPPEHGVNGESAVDPLRTPPSNGHVGGGGGGGAYFPDGDMYSSYVLLKSIRNDMEWGLVRDRCVRDLDRTPLSMADADRDRDEGRGGEEEEEEEGEEDLQRQFHFHLSGLHGVLSKLTRKADSLTTRYKQEIGVRGCGN